MQIYNQRYNQYKTYELYYKDGSPVILYFGEVFIQVLWHNILCPEYYISNYGKIFSINHGRFLSISHDKDGYCRSTIIIPEVGRKTIRVHRLEMMSFYPLDDYIDMVPNHEDGIKQNNFIANLKWITSIENTRHGWSSGLNTNIGENHPNSSILDEDVHKICALIDYGLRNCEICDQFQIFEPSDRMRFNAIISSIRYGKCHTNISRQYNFAKGYEKINYKPFFVHLLCNILSDGNTYTFDQIADMLNIDNKDRLFFRHFIGCLLNGDTYKNIASQYNMKRPLDKIDCNE